MTVDIDVCYNHIVMSPHECIYVDIFRFGDYVIEYETDQCCDNRISFFIGIQDFRKWIYGSLVSLTPRTRQPFDEKPFCHSHTWDVGWKLCVNGMLRNLYDGDEFTTG